MRSTRVLIAAGAAVALALSMPSVASAKSAPPTPPAPHVWPTQLAAPFSLAVDGHRVLIADGGSGTIGQLQSDGSVRALIEGVPGLTGVATRGAWMAYGSSVEQQVEGQEEPVILESGLNIRKPNGQTVYADLHAYEVAHNPDGINTYGITDPDSCLAGDPRATNTGLVDSHAYNVTSWKGDWLVADAGANAIMRVTDRGKVTPLAVLAPVPVEITPMIAGMLGVPECAVGDTFYAEPVPTGIAIGDGGAIYVSTLPGFPGMVASQGALWRIDSRTGAATQLASGLSQPTSIAVSGKSIYIAELAGAGVTVFKDGKLSPFVALPGALAVATESNGTVWATTMASETAPGSIVSIAKGKVKVRGHGHDRGHGNDHGNWNWNGKH